MRIANFNVQNMRLRQREGSFALDGAVDRDMGTAPDAMLDVIDRRLTAEVLRAVDADVVALEEVFDLAALEFFHDQFLVAGGANPYPHRVCLPGNDGQGMNVALMSRIAPVAVESHAAVTPEELRLTDIPEKMAGHPVFRRDCLEADLGALTLFVCHFKAPYPDVEEAARVRRAEAEAVRRIVERRFDDPAGARWLVIGDLNEPAGRAHPALAPLLGAFSVDLMARLRPGEDWTYAEPDSGRHSRPDALLASPALAAAYPDTVPRIFRSGLPPAADPLKRPHASDHAAVSIDFPGL